MELLRTQLRKAQEYWGDLWVDESSLHKAGIAHLYIRVGFIIGIYFVIDRLLMRATHLSFESFKAPFIYGEFLKTGFQTWRLVPLLVTAILVVIFRHKLLDSWSKLAYGSSLRLLVVVATAILAWEYATYDFNLYFNQSHLLDRSLLLLFIPLIWWRPVFVLPFLTLVLPIIWQFTFLLGYSWAAPYLLLRVLVLFVACFILYLINKRYPIFDFILILGSLYATHYWVPGWGKMSWEWIRFDQLPLILPSAYTNGWLSQLEPDQILSVLQSFLPFNVLMKLFVLFVEVGAFLFFFHRRLPVIMLAGWIAMHMGILLLTGISLWMWVVLDACLLFLFLRKDGFGQLALFSFHPTLISFLLIIGGGYWCKPVELAWYDLPFAYSYQIEAQTEDGKTIDLPTTFFSPYDYQFTMTGLGYLADHPMLYVGVKEDADFAKELLSLRSKDDFLSVEAAKGGTGIDEDFANYFDAFVQTFVHNWNERQNKITNFGLIPAPELILNYPRFRPDQLPLRIQEITIFQVTAFFGRDQYEEVRRIPIRSIKID